MRKGISHKKLSRSTNERKQLLRNLIRSITLRGYIETTISKAKFLQPNLEKLITVAKKNKFSNLRVLQQDTGDLEVARLLVEYGKLFADRKGGYTRIIRLGERSGDAAVSVKMEWVEKLIIAPIVSPKKDIKAEKIKSEKKIQPRVEKKFRPKDDRPLVEKKNNKK